MEACDPKKLKHCNFIHNCKKKKKSFPQKWLRIQSVKEIQFKCEVFIIAVFRRNLRYTSRWHYWLIFVIFAQNNQSNPRFYSPVVQKPLKWHENTLVLQAASTRMYTYTCMFTDEYIGTCTHTSAHTHIHTWANINAINTNGCCICLSAQYFFFSFCTVFWH